MKKLLQLFNMNVKEYRSGFVWICVSFFIFLLPKLFFNSNAASTIEFNSQKLNIDSLINLVQDDTLDEGHTSVLANPNYPKKEKLLLAGFNLKQAENIINYRLSGKRFNNIYEIANLCDMDTQKVKEIIAPWTFDIRSKLKNERQFNEKSFAQKIDTKIDINSADSAMLEALPLIGGKTASRILKFRDRLGGFISLSQVNQTFGIDSNAIIKNAHILYCDLSKIKKIKINSCSETELNFHPYIKKFQAKTIINFRKAHNKITVDNIYEIKTLSKNDLVKILPYLDFEQ